MTPQTDIGFLLFVGAVFFLIGLLGGGFEISAIKIPPVGRFPRILSTVIGGFFLLLGVIRLFPPGAGTSQEIPINTSTAPMEMLPTFTVPSPTATQALVLTPEELLQQAKQWPNIFSDNFNDNSGNWQDTDDSTSSEVTVAYNGQYDIFVETKGDSVREAFFRQAMDVPENFFMTIDTRAVDDNGCEYGIIFRGTINNEYYVFSIVNNKTKYKVVAVRGGERETLLKPMPLSKGIKSPTSLSVIGIGSYYRFFVNDRYVTEMSTDLIDGRRIGIEVFLCPERKVKFGFDDLQVNEQPSTFGQAVLSNLAFQSRVDTSSEGGDEEDKCQSGNKAIDGITLGYPDDSCNEWSSVGEGAGAWISLTFPNAKNLKQVVLYDRPNESDHVLDGVLTFSDGTSIRTGELPNDGSPKVVNFDTKVVDWVKFTVNSADGPNIGLSEIQVFGW